MNNARYADWADDCLGGDYLAAHPLRLVQLNYQREALEGRTVELRVRRRERELRLAGYLDGARSFDLLEEFE
jgi:acyl-ACP thioesterase